MNRIARLRVPLGFVCAGAALVLARPTWTCWSIGLAVATIGESIRIWAAGHLERWTGVTSSGPYRLMRHPLYAGSCLLGAGAAIAADNWIVAALAAIYLITTITAAIRSEEAALEAKFPGVYTDYRAGRAAPAARRFSWARAAANREYRAVLGLAAAFAFLAWRVFFS